MVVLVVVLVVVVVVEVVVLVVVQRENLELVQAHCTPEASTVALGNLSIPTT